MELGARPGGQAYSQAGGAAADQGSFDLLRFERPVHVPVLRPDECTEATASLLADKDGCAPHAHERCRGPFLWGEL